MNKTKLWFGFLVLFFFAAVTLMPLIGSSYFDGFEFSFGSGSNGLTGMVSYDSSADNETYILKEVLASNNSASYCEIFVPEPTIIIRMDDVSSYAPETDFIVDEILKRNKSIVLGLMPSELVKEGIITEYLDSIKLLSNIEFAQHGVRHLLEENNVSTDDISWGKQKIYKVFNMIPITYIPPYNELSEEGKRVIENSFMILSNKAGVIKEGKLAEIGFSAEVYHYDKESYSSIPEIIEECKDGIDKTNVCVVLIHPKEYRGDKAENLERFSNLLDELEKLNARFATFKDIVRCR